MIATDLRGVVAETNDCWGVLRFNAVNAVFDLESVFDWERELEILLEDKKVMAIILISNHPEIFGAGFNLSELLELAKSGDRKKAEEIIRRWGQFCLLLANSSKPTVAAINGLCVDVGLELALACQYRLAAPGALMGFYGSQQGLIPGLGGTQRLPRLIGAKNALAIMLGAQNRLVNSGTALDLSLIDAIADGPMAASVSQFAARILAGRLRVERSASLDLNLSDFIEGGLIDLTVNKPVSTVNSLIISVRKGMDYKELPPALEIELSEFLNCLFSADALAALEKSVSAS